MSNHIYGASILAEVAADNLASLAAAVESTILGIAEARAGWFGRTA